MFSKQLSSTLEVITNPEMYLWCPGYSLGRRGDGACVFLMTHFFSLSVEFCALARPGQSIMNLERVGRKGQSIMDSESADRQGPSLGPSWNRFLFGSWWSTL